MEIILNGIGSGLLVSLLIGPVFFTLIQTSVERGFKNGVLVAIGVALSDSFYITIAYLGISQIIADDNIKIYLAQAGGVMLLIFGFYNLFIKSKKRVSTDQHIKARSPWRYVAKGFIINGLTPVVLLFWLGTVSIATTKFGYKTPGNIFLFFICIIATVLTTDIIKVKLADKLRHLLTPKVIQRLNIVMGVALILFGGRLLFYGVQVIM